MSRARFAELVAELQRLDPVRIRRAAHAALPRLADRETFEATTSGLRHAELAEQAARVVIRQEILASYRERVSGELPIARIHLVKRAVGA